MNRKIKPCGDRVLVKLKSTKAAGMIEIPEQYQERDKLATQEAYVVELGPTAYKMLGDGAPWCREGDLVKISKYSGDDDKTIEPGEIYRIISDSDVFAIYPEERLNDR